MAVDDVTDRAAIVATAAEFAQTEIAPLVAEYDRAETLPLHLVARMADLGLLGGVVPQEYGGMGLDYVTFAQITEEIARVCQAMATLVTMPSGIVGAVIQDYGTAEQRQRWLVPLAQGRMLGQAGVTEPRSGSDVAGMETTYRAVDGGFVLSGAKTWITGLDISDFLVTFATRDRALKHRGIAAFIVPLDAEGVRIRAFEDKLGIRPLMAGEVAFDDVFLPADALLGEEGEGFRVAMSAVERGRLYVGARAVGLAQGCLDDSVAYARDRRAFDRSIAEFQIVQSKVCDMAVGIETARLLVKSCAEAMQRGERARSLSSMAKMYASDVAARSAADAVQIHGANGVSPEYRVGRFYRDAKVLQIVEGSNDLHRALIGEMALGLRSAG
jgi:alkylation response protein AidB-like acyl-CoA dehydrogenase